MTIQLAARPATPHADRSRRDCPLPDAVDPLALALNENPFPPLPAVRAALIRSIDPANRYPEFLPWRLRATIAEHLGIREDCVVVGAGATGVTQQILHAVAGPGDRIVLSEPTFDGYPILAQMAGLYTVAVPLRPDGHQDLDAMAEAAPEARVVTICRPHNPTGTVESGPELERFLARTPRDCIVVLDEAYVEFVVPQFRVDAVDLVERFPNLVVVRTFSKAYGLAGLRIGYAFAAPDLAAEIWSMQLPFGMSALSLAAVVASYQAGAQLRRRTRLIIRERRRLCGWLQVMGIGHTETQANFVYLPARDRPWSELIGDSPIRVRHYARGDMRITVGAGSSTGAILAALRNGTCPGPDRSGSRIEPGQEWGRG